jgi:hypothetical protein
VGGISDHKRKMGQPPIDLNEIPFIFERTSGISALLKEVDQQYEGR